MHQAELALIYEYNSWSNGRILDAAAQVSEQQYIVPTSFPFHSLRGTLVHIVDTEYGWRTLIENAARSTRWEAKELTETDLPTFEEARARFRQEHANMLAYIAGLTDAGASSIVRYEVDNGIFRERPVWHCIYHLINHGTQHRGEAAAMLTDFGRSPGDLDFTVFMNERK